MTVATVLAANDQYLGDAGDFLLINRFARRTGWLHGFMSAYAETLGLVVCALLVLIGWWLARQARSSRAMASVVWVAVGTLIAVGLNQPLVSAAHERRPFQSIPHVLMLVSHSKDYGFPSDHATMAGAVAAGLCFVNRRLGIVAWVAALLLSFARVYVGVHYPHDVVAGLLFGAAVIVIGRMIFVPLLAVLVRRLATTPLRPVLSAGPIDVAYSDGTEVAPATKPVRSSGIG